MLWLIPKAPERFLFLCPSDDCRSIATRGLPFAQSSPCSPVRRVCFHGERKPPKAKCYYRVSRSSALFIPASSVLTLGFSVPPRGWKCFPNTTVRSYNPLHFSGFQIRGVWAPICTTHWGPFPRWRLPGPASGWLPSAAGAANFVINISGSTQWHFKWNTNYKILLFLVTLFSQIWKEIAIKWPKAHLSLLNSLGCCHGSAKFSISSPLDRNCAPLEQQWGENWSLMDPENRSRSAWLVLLLGWLLQLRLCESMLHQHNFWIVAINQYKLVGQLIDKESRYLTEIIDEEYALYF